MNKKLLKTAYSKYFENTNLDKGYYYAPGRVNLIGEHTDYNNGYVLPMAIDKRIYSFIQLREDNKINIYSIDLDKNFSTDTNKLEKNEKSSWSNYIIGVVSVLKKEGYDIKGFNMVFTGDIPQGAGLSSSAALEVVTVYGLADLNSIDLSPVQKAVIAQKAENNFVGVECGIMDQYISCLGEKDNALLIDCESYEYKKVLFDDDMYEILIIDSKVQRGLVDSEYNLRKKQCINVVKYFKEKYDKEIKSLRDVNLNDLFKYQEDLKEDEYKRAVHVLTENIRVLDFSESIKKGDYKKAGSLMYASHLSLKNEYEVSCEELDFLVETALDIDGVLGARMTGAGFGGCTVNLIEAENKAKIINQIKINYIDKYDKEPDFYISRPENGAQMY